MKKISVSLEANVVESATVAAELRGQSLSAWLNDAARKALKIEQGLQAMAEWEREEGPITDEERAEGERIIDDLLRRTGRRP